ncbi:MAG TPA: hypothetical protein DCZ91_16475 [Lachnospiraceae bacterium]|nr:hypothetical protein [Lachnospiraceae bacterium]
MKNSVLFDTIAKSSIGFYECSRTVSKTRSFLKRGAKHRASASIKYSGHLRMEKMKKKGIKTRNPGW